LRLCSALKKNKGTTIQVGCQRKEKRKNFQGKKKKKRKKQEGGRFLSRRP